MERNPYAKNLGGLDPMAVLAATSAQLAGLVARMPAEQVALRPPAGKWTAREIVAHLADCELVFGFRLRQALAEANPIQQPFDQDRWAARYGNCDMKSSLRLFAAARGWNLLLLAGLTAAERDRPTSHPERGEMTVWTIAETMAGHDRNHLVVLEGMAAKPVS